MSAGADAKQPHSASTDQTLQRAAQSPVPASRSTPHHAQAEDQHSKLQPRPAAPAIAKIPVSEQSGPAADVDPNNIGHSPISKRSGHTWHPNNLRAAPA